MTIRSLNDAERTDWLRLIRTENVGPITFFRLIEQFGSAAAALDALPTLARRGGRAKPLVVPAKAEIRRELEGHAKAGARLIAACEPDYPAALRLIDDAPPILSVLGHPALLTRRAIAIVGARNASTNGGKIAEKLARELGDAGFLVVSGLARGIDTHAHRGSLRTGTAAVLAGGVDIVYPEENADLYRRVVEQGVVVAETALGTAPQARHFPRRNRIISGLALGVVVIEAALKSGSLITARLALDQNRELFAVPGSPLDPRCQGTNNLLREGAVVTENAEDVIAALSRSAPLLEEPENRGFVPIVPAPIDDTTLAAARALIEQGLSHSPVTVDELVRGCQLSAPVVLMVLLELELAGKLERQPGNLVNLI
ncbi:MAG: DNA-processing protein DprA [Azospirillaceae bacterium]|nr:DNA-processing protein DprA [Azospirillaceae bacterium]